MSWAVGYDSNWRRDVGYGVPAYCDHPNCEVEIDRGLANVCGGEPYGGEFGCGLYFCAAHLFFPLNKEAAQYMHYCQMCDRCSSRKKPFQPSKDHADWIHHKSTDPTWAEWRKDQEKERSKH